MRGMVIVRLRKTLEMNTHGMKIKSRILCLQMTENEEEMRPSEAYRENIDPKELLKLGKTFSDADEFKHTCLRYTLKTRYNIKFYRSSCLQVGAKCAATMREDEVPCPWKIYCSYEKSKHKLQIKTYVMSIDARSQVRRKC